MVGKIGKTNKQKSREEIGSSRQLNIASKVPFQLYPSLLHLGNFWNKYLTCIKSKIQLVFSLFMFSRTSNLTWII